MSAIPLLLVSLAATDPAPPPRTAGPSTQDVRAAVEKSLPFLEQSTATWRADRKCVSCHQVPFTIWALTGRVDGGSESSLSAAAAGTEVRASTRPNTVTVVRVIMATC